MYSRAKRRHIEPVSIGFDRVLARTDIRNWRPETCAGNCSDVIENPENCASHILNVSLTRGNVAADFCEPDIACRDRTGWLGI